MSNTYTLKEISNLTGISKDALGIFMDHYSLSKYLCYIFNKNNLPIRAVDISEDFIYDFINYIAKRRHKKRYNIEEIEIKLEELLCHQNHQITA